MAPFTPFITEHIYQNLRRLQSKPNPPESIHYLMLPKPIDWLQDNVIEEIVNGMQTVINLGRLARDRANLPIKSPLAEVIVVHTEEAFLTEIRGLEKYILEELNVRKLTLSSNKAAYNVKLRAEPDHKLLGQKYKKDFKALLTAIKGLSDAVLEECLEKKGTTVLGHWIDLSELRIHFVVGEGSENGKIEVASSGSLLVILSTERAQDLIDEGTAREVINRIQKLRKKGGLVPTDPITVYYAAEEPLLEVIHKQMDFIQKAVKSEVLSLSQAQAHTDFLLKEDFTDIKEMGKLTLGLVKEPINP